MTDEVPMTDDRPPAQVVEDAVGRALRLAATWPSWDGQPLVVGDRVYTPHKAVRRLSDHLVDHLAELEARLAGQPSLPDHWHASAVTTSTDLAPFTSVDLDEARSRLTRLAQVWSLRLHALTEERLDRDDGQGWTLRQVAFHLGDTFYADSVGHLPPTQPPPSTVAAPATATAADARFVHEQWHQRARARDVAGLAELYTPDAVLESPLVPRILPTSDGRLVGRAAIERFLTEGTRCRPDPLVRWQRSDQYLFDGRTLVWEYPRAAPDGDQVDIIEVCDLTGPLISRHRIYWGWYGTEIVTANSQGTKPSTRP